MKGIELSEKYYNEFGAPMLQRDFADILPLLTVGLIGSGSECLGYDDELSQDHDFEPRFCIFILDNSIDSKTEFALERAYSKLPQEFMGFERSKLAPVGARRHGVIKLSDFLIERLGRADGELTIEDWFSLPDHSIAEVLCGKLFYDGPNILTSIRQKLMHRPTDVKLKKLAGNLLLMAQSGQYNYSRCISRGETGGAQLAIIEFVKRAIQTIFLLNDKYMPYYKWSFRALSELPKLGELSYSLEYLISSENGAENAKLKADMIEDIASLVIAELNEQNLTEAICGDLEKHAYSVNDHITDNDIRNRNILFAV